MNSLIARNKVFGIILISVGVICIASGGYMLIAQKHENSVVDLNRTSLSDSSLSSVERNVKESSGGGESSRNNMSIDGSNHPLESTTSSATSSDAPKSLSAADNQSDDTGDSSHKKGVEFEKYIVGRFGRKFWSIKEWRSDKSVNNRYVESSMNPDLEMKLKVKDKEYVVAIECKWRKSATSDGTVKWSYPAQFQRYQDFAKKSNIPVFVAIGIGGIPSRPDHLYIVPLKSIDSPTVLQTDLAKYEIKSGSYFFYDPSVGDFKRD